MPGVTRGDDTAVPDHGATTALVLSGGGVAGITWEIGVLHGLRATGGAPAAALDARASSSGPPPARKAADLGDRFGRAVASVHS